MAWLDNLDIVFECNDLTSMKMDALVCPVTVELAEYGKLSSQIFNIAKSSLKRDLYEIKKKLPNERLILGEVAAINCKPAYQLNNIGALIFAALWERQSEYSENLFYKSYINSLREAFKLNIKSIGLPLFTYDGNLSFCAKAIIKTICDLDSLKNSSEFSVDEIYFVSKNSNHLDFFEELVLQKILNHR
jgi:O-acetyl-ADP-ribose deacetylase (regulator of RNase III)